MDWLQEKKSIIEKNLLNKNWQLQEIKTVDYSDNLIYTSKKFCFLFSRYYIYFVKKEIKILELKKIEQEIERLNLKYHGLWLAVKKIDDELINYAKDSNLGVMKLS